MEVAADQDKDVGEGTETDGDCVCVGAEKAKNFSQGSSSFVGGVGVAVVGVWV